MLYKLVPLLYSIRARPVPSIAPHSPDFQCDTASGVASAVLPAVKILDAIYSTRITLEGLATRYGMKQEEWPEAVLESLKARHNQIYGQIEDQICSLGGAYHPLGTDAHCLHKLYEHWNCWDEVSCRMSVRACIDQ